MIKQEPRLVRSGLFVSGAGQWPAGGHPPLAWAAGQPALATAPTQTASTPPVGAYLLAKALGKAFAKCLAVKQRYLLPLLLLAPLLAHADALSAYGLGEALELYLGIFLAITVGGLLLVSWWRPQWRRLYVGAVFACCMAVLCYFGTDGPSLFWVATVLFTVVVLGLLLGSQARSAALRKAVSLVVKVAGLGLLVVLLLLMD